MGDLEHNSVSRTVLRLMQEGELAAHLGWEGISSARRHGLPGFRKLVCLVYPFRRVVWLASMRTTNRFVDNLAAVLSHVRLHRVRTIP
jgi:hypothetical protein